jgi:hypothetical protein
MRTMAIGVLIALVSATVRQRRGVDSSWLIKPGAFRYLLGYARVTTE